MGPQPSSLNCKVNEQSEKNEVTLNKEFFARINKTKQFKQQNNPFQTNLTPDHLTTKSPPPQLTRATSERTLTAKSSRQVVKTTVFIPEHQSITKVSERPFRFGRKEKQFYVEQKVKTLGEIVQSRYNTSKHFPYSQILGLTESLVYSLAYMVKKGCNHHDFYSTNVYYTEGRFKVVNPLQLSASGFHLTSQRQRFSFLSPQLIIAILEGHSQSNIGDDIMNKSDVFAIGMILLQVCSLQPSSECYDEESYNIVDAGIIFYYEVIKERLGKVAQIYTTGMADCISLMLEYQFERRADPLVLAQVVHWKVENQKGAAAQMEGRQAQGPSPQQSGQGQPGQRMMPPHQGLPPHMVPPQQVRPPPPYMHQPNLNPNVIAVSMPNEQYGRIGPNNQGFLSSSSLQQKLRVIELIKEHPKEEDEDVEYESKIEESQVEMPPRNNQDIKMVEQRIYLEQPKPQYPLVESIYSEKPLIQKYSQQESNVRPGSHRQPLYMAENKPLVYQPQLREPNNRITVNSQAYEFNSRPPLNFHQYQQFQQRKVQQFPHQQQRMQIRVSEQRKDEGYTNVEIRKQFPVFEEKMQQVYTNELPIKTISDMELKWQQKADEPQLNYQPLTRKGEQQQTFTTSYSYATSATGNLIKNSSTINNIYTGTNQGNLYSKQGNILPQSESVPAYSTKYGTSFQSEMSGETIEERVQRVLAMSRNAR